MVQLPPGSTQEQTQVVLNEVSDYFINTEKNVVESAFTVNGFGFAGQGQNMGLAFVVLKNWDERKAKEDKVEAIVGRANAKFSQNSGAIIYAFNIPAIVELGTSSGFDLELMDNANHGHEALTQARNQLLGLAGKHPDMLVQVRPNGMEDTSQYHLYVDQQKAEALGVDISTINATMSTMFGGTYVNDFIDRGRVKKSIFRVMHNSVCFLRIFLNSMSAITTVRWFRSPPLLIRRKIRGHLVHHVWSVTTVYRLCRFRECRTGKSSGDAMNLMEDRQRIAAGLRR